MPAYEKSVFNKEQVFFNFGNISKIVSDFLTSFFLKYSKISSANLKNNIKLKLFQ